MLCIDGFNYEIQDNSEFLNINTNKILQIITVCFIYKNWFGKQWSILKISRNLSFPQLITCNNSYDISVREAAEG